MANLSDVASVCRTGAVLKGDSSKVTPLLKTSQCNVTESLTLKRSPHGFLFRD